MGNCCEKSLEAVASDIRNQLHTGKDDEDFPHNPLENPNHSPSGSVLVPKMPDFQASTAQYSADLNLKQLMSPADVLRMENFLFDQIELHRPSMIKVTDGNSEEIFEAALYGENISKPDSLELINVLFQTFKCNFKSEFLLFGYLNQLVYLSPSIEEYELVKCEMYPDEIYLLERLRTERILVVSPRNMLTIRVVKRLGPGRYMDSSQSVEFHQLCNHPTVKELWKAKVEADPATPIIVGTYFEDRGKHSHCCSFSKTDFHFSIPFKFAIIFLRKILMNFLEKATANYARHFTENFWDGGANIIWFKDDQGRLLEPEWVRDKSLARFFADMNDFVVELKKPVLVHENIRVPFKGEGPEGGQAEETPPVAVIELAETPKS